MTGRPSRASQLRALQVRDDLYNLDGALATIDDVAGLHETRVRARGPALAVLGDARELERPARVRQVAVQVGDGDQASGSASRGARAVGASADADATSANSASVDATTRAFPSETAMDVAGTRALPHGSPSRDGHPREAPRARLGSAPGHETLKRASDRVSRRA